MWVGVVGRRDPRGRAKLWGSGRKGWLVVRDGDVEVSLLLYSMFVISCRSSWAGVTSSLSVDLPWLGLLPPIGPRLRLRLLISSTIYLHLLSSLLFLASRSPSTSPHLACNLSLSFCPFHTSQPHSAQPTTPAKPTMPRTTVCHITLPVGEWDSVAVSTIETVKRMSENWKPASSAQWSFLCRRINFF